MSTEIPPVDFSSRSKEVINTLADTLRGIDTGEVTDQLHLSLDVMQRLAQVASSSLVSLAEEYSAEDKNKARILLVYAVSGLDVESDDPNDPAAPTEQLVSLRDTTFGHIADILNSDTATADKLHELHYLEGRLGDFAFRLNHTIETSDEQSTDL